MGGTLHHLVSSSSEPLSEKIKIKPFVVFLVLQPVQDVFGPPGPESWSRSTSCEDSGLRLVLLDLHRHTASPLRSVLIRSNSSWKLSCSHFLLNSWAGVRLHHHHHHWASWCSESPARPRKKPACSANVRWIFYPIKKQKYFLWFQK